MTFSGVLRAPQAGHITCRSQCTSAAWRGGTSMRKEQAANRTELIRACGEVVRCLSAGSARCGLCRDDRSCCRAQRPQQCAGGIDIGSNSRRDSTSSSLASHRLASRSAAPSAVQHSTDVRSASAAMQSTDTAVANEGDLHGSNGAGYSEDAAAERPNTSPPCSRDNGQRPLDQHDQPPESGILTHAQFGQVLSDPQSRCTARGIPTDAALSSEQSGHTKAEALFLPDEKSQIRDSWRKIMRWSKVSCIVLAFTCKSNGFVQWIGRQQLNFIANARLDPGLLLIVLLVPCANRCSTGTMCPSWRRRRRWSSLAAAALGLRWALRWRARRQTWMSRCCCGTHMCARTSTHCIETADILTCAHGVCGALPCMGSCLLLVVRRCLLALGESHVMNMLRPVNREIRVIAPRSSRCPAT